MFSGQCKKHPKRLKETTQRWCANYIIKMASNLFLIWTLNSHFFLQNDSGSILYPKILGRQQAHGSPQVMIVQFVHHWGLRSCCFSRVPLSWITPMYWFTMVPYSMDRKDPRFETQLSVFFLKAKQNIVLFQEHPRKVFQNGDPTWKLALLRHRHNDTIQRPKVLDFEQGTSQHGDVLGLISRVLDNIVVFFLHIDVSWRTPSRSCVSNRRLTLGRKRVFFATKDQNASKFLCKFCSGKTR